MAVGHNAQAGPGSVAIGADAGAGLQQNAPTNVFNQPNNEGSIFNQPNNYGNINNNVIDLPEPTCEFQELSSEQEGQFVRTRYRVTITSKFAVPRFQISVGASNLMISNNPKDVLSVSPEIGGAMLVSGEQINDRQLLEISNAFGAYIVEVKTKGKLN